MADLISISKEPIINTKLNDIIQNDMQSEEKIFMMKASSYYKNVNDVSKMDFREYKANGIVKVNENRSNHRISHNFMKLLVNQAVSFMVGNPVTYMADDTKLQDYLDELFMFDFDDSVLDWVKEARIKGKGFLHVYYDNDGTIDYTVIPSEQIIPIYSDGFNKKLVEVIRYYSIPAIDSEGNSILRKKVEWWTDKDVKYFIEDEKGNYLFQNESAHWYTSFSTTPNEAEAHSWGKVPFIQLNNNEDKSSDLVDIKGHIDAYDILQSEFVNQIADVREILIKVLGYSGSSADEILQAFRGTGIVKIDSPDGNIDVLKSEIPVDARQAALTNLKENIYSFGMGVDTTNTNRYGTSLSGIALKMMYAPLELKCNPSIRKLKKALYNFLWFIIDDYNRKTNSSVNYRDIKLTVNKNLIINETEIIENLAKSKGIISDETIIENHPYVENPTLELERLEAQEQTMIEQISSYNNFEQNNPKEEEK